MAELFNVPNCVVTLLLLSTHCTQVVFVFVLSHVEEERLRDRRMVCLYYIGYIGLNLVLKVFYSLDQYIDELEVIGTNQPQHLSKFDMMSVVQEEEEEDSEMLGGSMSERSALKISLHCLIKVL